MFLIPLRVRNQAFADIGHSLAGRADGYRTKVVRSAAPVMAAIPAPGSDEQEKERAIRDRRDQLGSKCLPPPREPPIEHLSEIPLSSS